MFHSFHVNEYRRNAGRKQDAAEFVMIRGTVRESDSKSAPSFAVAALSAVAIEPISSVAAPAATHFRGRTNSIILPDRRNHGYVF
jgi:hypothetical protein